MGEANDAVLSRLLDEDLSSDPTAANRLTNHLPMALVAKQRLGASDSELRRFAHRYSRRVVPLAKVEHELDASNWTAAIGRRGASGDLRRYFVGRVREDGVDATLRAHLPALLAGIGGAAFHGAIRLSYALEVTSPARVAAGLGYLAVVARPLADIQPGPARTEDPVEVLDALSDSGEWSAPVLGRNIDEEMRAVAADATFADVPSSLHYDRRTWSRLEAAALLVYASTDDFTALHGVTGLAAISSLREWTDDTASLDRFAFQSFAAAFLTVGAPPLWSKDRLDAFVAAHDVAPSEIEAVGANSDDEHTAKLIYTAMGRWRRTGDELYRAVAARKAGLRSSTG